MAGGGLSNSGEYYALPEHETSVCPQCERVAYGRGTVWTCGECDYRWRWAGDMGDQ